MIYFIIRGRKLKEDRHYFEMLASEADAALYAHIELRGHDGLRYIEFYWRARAFRKNLHRDIVLLASINNYVFSAIAERQANSELVTFDDGSINFCLGSMYHRESRTIRQFSDLLHRNGRADLYRQLFGARDVDSIRTRISRHYTLHPKFENIARRRSCVLSNEKQLGS